MPRLIVPAPTLRRPRRGMTLVEVMIVFVILALVGTTLTSLLTRQQRFYRDAADAVVVRRELRGSGTLLPQELRAISSAGGDMLNAQSDRFTVRAAIGSSVICNINVARTQIDLLPQGLTNHEMTSWYLTPAAGDTVFIFDEGAGTGAADDVWQQRAISTFATTTSACVSGSSAFVVAADAAKPRFRLTLSSALPATVTVGSVIRITRPTRYSLYQPSGSTNWYLGYEEYTGGAWLAVQPIAGPLTAGGAQFKYYDTTATAITATSGSALRGVARVDLTLAAAARSAASRERAGTPFTDSLALRIGVRNYR